MIDVRHQSFIILDMATIFHVVSRAIESKKIFEDESNKARFVHDLFEFNDEKPALNVGRLISSKENRMIDVRRQSLGPRKLLVKILTFCIMPNHYHLMLTPVVENGVSLFMKKLNGGFAKFYNIKNERKGPLFERKYKAIPVKDEAHFIHLPYYIHCNPLDSFMPEWRDRKISNPQKALKFLENYRWSSHLDYLGKKNFPSVTQREFLLEFFGGEKGYKSKFEKWIRDLDLDSLENVILE